MLRTSTLSGAGTRMVVAALSVMACNMGARSSGGPVMLRRNSFDGLGVTLKMPTFNDDGVRQAKWPHRSEQSARLKAKRRGR